MRNGDSQARRRTARARHGTARAGANSLDGYLIGRHEPAVEQIDDPVCVLENVREHVGLVERLENALLVLTARGSHGAFFEGTRPRRWLHRLVAQYLGAVHADRAAARLLSAAASSARP